MAITLIFWITPFWQEPVWNKRAAEIWKSNTAVGKGHQYHQEKTWWDKEPWSHEQSIDGKKISTNEGTQELYIKGKYVDKLNRQITPEGEKVENSYSKTIALEGCLTNSPTHPHPIS